MQYLPKTFFEFICALVLSLVVCIIRHFPSFLSSLGPIFFVQSRLYFICSHPPLRADHLVHLQSEDAPCTGDRDQLSIKDINLWKEYAHLYT